MDEYTIDSHLNANCIRIAEEIEAHANGRAYEDESGDYVTCDEDGNPCDEPLYTLDVLDLHPEHKSAWDKAKASYYSFLDYDEDSYGTVTDYAETK